MAQPVHYDGSSSSSSQPPVTLSQEPTVATGVTSGNMTSGALALVPVSQMSTPSTPSQPTPWMVVRKTTGLRGGCGSEIPPEILGIILSLLNYRDVSAFSRTSRGWHAIVIYEMRNVFGRLMNSVRDMNRSLAVDDRIVDLNSEYIQRMQQRLQMMSVPSAMQGASVYRVHHAIRTLLHSLSCLLLRVKKKVRDKFCLGLSLDASVLEQKVLKIWDCHLEPSWQDACLTKQGVRGNVGMLARGELEALSKVFVHNQSQNPVRNESEFPSILHTILSRDGCLDKVWRSFGCRDRTFYTAITNWCLSRESLDEALKELGKLPVIHCENVTDAERESKNRIYSCSYREYVDETPLTVIEIADSIEDVNEKLAAFKEIVKAFFEISSMNRQTDELNQALYCKNMKWLLHKIAERVSSVGNKDEAKKIEDMMPEGQLNMEGLRRWCQTDNPTLFPLYAEEDELVAEIVAHCIVRMGALKTMAVVDGIKHAQVKTTALQSIALHFLIAGNGQMAQDVAKKIPMETARSRTLQGLTDIQTARLSPQWLNTFPDREATFLTSTSSEAYVLNLMQICPPLTLDEAEACITGKREIPWAMSVRQLMRHIVMLGGVRKGVNLLAHAQKLPNSRGVAKVVAEAGIRSGQLDELMTVAGEMQWPEQMVLTICEALYARGQVKQVNAIIEAHVKPQSALVFDQYFCFLLLLNGAVDILVKKLLPIGRGLPQDISSFSERIEEIMTFLVETGELRKAIAIAERVKIESHGLDEDDLENLASIFSRLRITD